MTKAQQRTKPNALRLTLKTRQVFYHQIATTLKAGIPLLSALEKMAQHTHASEIKQLTKTVIASITKGKRFSAALKYAYQGHYPQEIVILDVAEMSGRLDAALFLLATQLEKERAFWSKLASNVAYPVFLVHFAAFSFPFPDFFTGKISFFIYFCQAAMILGPVYLGALMGKNWYQGSKTRKQVSPSMESVLLLIPIVRSVAINLDLYHVIYSYLIMVKSGVDIKSAMNSLVATPRLGKLRKTMRMGQVAVNKGTPITTGLVKSDLIAKAIIQAWQLGEETGTLEKQLTLIISELDTQLTTHIDIITTWVPKLIYLAVLGFIGIKIVEFYTGYFDTLLNL